MGAFYIPPTKKELITELIKKWPDNKKDFASMQKKQLIAIFISLRIKQARGAF